MQDETLSRAVVDYVWGIPRWSVPGWHSQEVRKLLADQAPELLERVDNLVKEVFEVRPEGWNLVEIGERVKVVLRRNHPELTDEAVKALVGLYTYSWR